MQYCIQQKLYFNNHNMIIINEYINKMIVLCRICPTEN